jgi:hypothetical protein
MPIFLTCLPILFRLDVCSELCEVITANNDILLLDEPTNTWMCDLFYGWKIFYRITRSSCCGLTTMFLDHVTNRTIEISLEKYTITTNLTVCRGVEEQQLASQTPTKQIDQTEKLIENLEPSW